MLLIFYTKKTTKTLSVGNHLFSCGEKGKFSVRTLKNSLISGVINESLRKLRGLVKRFPQFCLAYISGKRIAGYIL
jgi:hypothetical protein